ncbi:TPA: hypothetical protein EYN98_28235 [Candidatus Poribacteria bacterium]|jgi:hypothetical protein|nr:hypothetical protein [Candidatus Poribacteria bacterium]HIA69861.1 hypothetical protein [Candidatus Poribacteria bacterium]HIB88146.1 hypothetical protein [Candidatus Poribacteria bacterium]HIC03842.1 hypothetical protein [Candidatus Poribacteria bacterium]HIM12380.1 hypothetical protein [Candidatus Poribacteria bacterium]
MPKQSSFEVDGQFLRQVYYLTVILAVVLTALFGIIYGFPTALSFVVGSFLSLGAVLVLEFVVRLMVKPGSSTKTKRWLGLIALGKYTFIFVGFYFLMKADWLNIYSLAVGVGLVQVVVILKAIKLMVLILLGNNTSKNS